MTATHADIRRRQAAEVIAQIETDQAARHVEYQAYLCMMTDHGCECVALDFEAWAQVPR